MTNLLRDTWLSNVLACDAWKVTVDASGMDDATRHSIVQTGAPSFLYAKVPTTDIKGVAALSALGFNVIDTSITLERPAADYPRPTDTGACRFAEPSDRAAVSCLAQEGFAFSRLHLDPDVSHCAADRSRASVTLGLLPFCE